MTENSPKLASKFTCNCCDYNCSKESDYNKHILTRKHQINDTTTPKTRLTEYKCKCGKKYKFRQGLSVHKKICTQIHDEQNIVNDNKMDDKNIIELLIKENTEFKNIVMEIVKSNSDLQKQMMEVCKNGNTTNINSNNSNSNNKTFNLQVFLNEQCKDAMNISDFANSFDLQLSDLESVGQLGYVEGMTKIIVDKLNGMDVYKRPMHCSDSKREIIYIKDENIWAREEKSNPKLRQAIKNVTFRNMKLVATWSDANPESKDHESRLNDKYMELVIQSTGGKGAITDSENKIIRRIAKEIIIEKNNHI